MALTGAILAGLGISLLSRYTLGLDTEQRELAVLDGIPVFNLVRETLPGVDVLGFRGVVNSTTNYVLTAMENGRTFDDALTEMQAAAAQGEFERAARWRGRSRAGATA